MDTRLVRGVAFHFSKNRKGYPWGPESHENAIPLIIRAHHTLVGRLYFGGSQNKILKNSEVVGIRVDKDLPL
jgi:hypothetical protein